MPAVLRLIVRDGSTTTSPSSLNPTMTNLLIALVALIVSGILLVAALYFLRSHRASKQKLQALQVNSKSPPVHSKKPSNHRRLTITAAPNGRRSESVYLYSSDKHALISGAASPPQSPIPEIRITFPEEEDGYGKRKSGRVVVVRISEAGGLGLEPYLDEEHLPPYQTVRDGGFESLDLDRIGGLKELERGVGRC